MIIPMYNAEKFITQFLESILAQTFRDFEAIIVNDCSTDNSRQIAESYLEKFDGRLKIIDNEKNSGAGLSRNKGINLSRGEYIFFVDADDMITETALEELYPLAKEFDADVVQCEKGYGVTDDLKIVGECTEQDSDFVNKPTLETVNLEERVQKILQKKFWVGSVSKLVRRDFLIEHEIFFPPIFPREDDIWNYGLIFHAKNFLRVPNVVYFVRGSVDSFTRAIRPAIDHVNIWLSPIFAGLKIIDDLMNKFDFFEQKPQYRYALLEHFTERAFSIIFSYSAYVPPFIFYKSIKQKFGKQLGEQDVLVSTLCAFANTQQKNFALNQQKFNDFAAKTQKRIAELESQLQNK